MTATSRKKELLSVFEKALEGVLTIVSGLIDDMVHLEGQLQKLRDLPFMLTDVKNPKIIKRTESSILYATLISRYTDIINKLTTILRKQENEEESPLRQYLSTLEDTTYVGYKN